MIDIFDDVNRILFWFVYVVDLTKLWCIPFDAERSQDDSFGSDSNI